MSEPFPVPGSCPAAEATSESRCRSRVGAGGPGWARDAGAGPPPPVAGPVWAVVAAALVSLPRRLATVVARRAHLEPATPETPPSAPVAPARRPPRVDRVRPTVHRVVRPRVQPALRERRPVLRQVEAVCEHLRPRHERVLPPQPRLAPTPSLCPPLQPRPRAPRAREGGGGSAAAGAEWAVDVRCVRGVHRVPVEVLQAEEVEAHRPRDPRPYPPSRSSRRWV